MFPHVFFSFKLCICQDPTIALAYTAQNTKKFAHFSLVSLSPRARSRPSAERIRQSEGRLSRPPKTALERSYLTEKFSPENRILRPRRKKTPARIPLKKNDHTYIYICQKWSRWSRWWSVGGVHKPEPESTVCLTAKVTAYYAAATVFLVFVFSIGYHALRRAPLVFLPITCVLSSHVLQENPSRGTRYDREMWHFSTEMVSEWRGDLVVYPGHGICHPGSKRFNFSPNQYLG